MPMSDAIDRAWDDVARKIETDVAADIAAGEIDAEIDAARECDATTDKEPEQEIG
jgi:hypothetical protein